jgi:hypothetical protein
MEGIRSCDAMEATSAIWLSLTDLGRLYGISAVHCGRLLSQAGLRASDGQPSQRALQQGQAFVRHPQHSHRHALWNREGCRPSLEASGLRPVHQATLIQQWADLLAALSEGSPSISTSAAQMAEELPGDLVEPVNQQLRELGCGFQVQGRQRRTPRSIEPTPARAGHRTAARAGLIGQG